MYLYQKENNEPLRIICDHYTSIINLLTLLILFKLKGLKVKG